MSATNQAGKGSKPRPVNKKVYDKNYDNIFRKKLTKTLVDDTVKE